MGRTMLNRTMPDMLDAVKQALERKGWTSYRLVQELKGRRPGGKNVPASVVYEFLRGDTAINSTDLGLIFDVLGLRVLHDDEPTQPKGKKK